MKTRAYDEDGKPVELFGYPVFLSDGTENPLIIPELTDEEIKVFEELWILGFTGPKKEETWRDRPPML